MVPIVVVAFEICAKAYDITVGVPGLESVQDFLIKLDMKPCMYSAFFTNSCHRQTYQKYEQSQQKLGTIFGNKVFYKSKFPKTFFDKSWSPSQIFFIEFFSERFDQSLTQKIEMFEEVVHSFGSV